MNLERFINQQNIERYLKFLEYVSDDTQRRQIANLLEEEQHRAEELRAHLSARAAWQSS